MAVGLSCNKRSQEEILKLLINCDAVDKTIKNIAGETAKILAINQVKPKAKNVKQAKEILNLFPS